MKAAWDALKKAGLEPTGEMWAFFGGDLPDAAGVSVDLGDAVVGYSREMEAGFEVHLDKLPDNVKVIRFVNSY